MEFNHFLIFFLTLIIFAKKLHQRCFTGLEIGFSLRVWNIELTLVPSLQIKPNKYSARKFVWHYFWKAVSFWWDSKQNECLCKGSRPIGSVKMVLWNISQNSQENLCDGISFLVFSYEVLRNLQEHLFCRVVEDKCWWFSSINSNKASIGKRNYNKLWSKN